MTEALRKSLEAEEAEELRSPIPVYKPEQSATLDINAAMLMVRRLGKQKLATASAVLVALLDMIGSDALTREVRAAQRETLK